MEESKKFQDLVNEMNREHYDSGYNDGYQECVGNVRRVLRAYRELIEFLKKPMDRRSEEDLKGIIIRMNEATIEVEGVSI